MQKQVITIDTNGNISGLQVKPGRGVDLQRMARDIGTKAQTERVSEIAWDEMEQAWFVLPIRGFFKDCAITQDTWEAYCPFPPQGMTRVQHDTKVLLFEDYEMAVKAEVQILDAARSMGRF